MANKVTHFFPDAMVIFVKGFTSNTPKLEDTIIARNTSEIKEISAVSVNLTVKNNPGTFSITLVDTANRFIEPDEPDKEIGALSAQGQRKTTKLTTTPTEGNPDQVTTSSETKDTSEGGNYYEFAHYKDWLNFTHGTLEDLSTKARYPISYRRDAGGKVVERWALDDYGLVIKVVTPGTAYTEAAFQAEKNGSTVNYDTVRGASTLVVKYRLWKNTNREFVSRYKDTEEQGFGESNFKKGRCKISAMDRVVIFMSQRFSSDRSVNETANHKMMRVFTGVVNSVEQSYSENQNTINITGEDVTKYLRLSVINVNPALPLEEGKIVDQTQNEQISILQDIFKGATPAKIIELILLGGNTGSEFSPQTIRGVSQYVIARVTNAAGINQDIVVDPVTGKFTEENAPTSRQQSTHSIADIRKILGTLFQKSSVHIINPFAPGTNLTGFRAYEMAFNSSWSHYQAGFKTRREIAYAIAEETNFTFYADKNGHIWYRPQRFANSHILGAKNPSVYIIDTESIISFGFIEDDSNIYSSVYIGTAPPYGLDGATPIGGYNNSIRDDLIVLQYGQRIFTYYNPLITVNALSNDKILALHAKTVLQRILASQFQGQITILGRPELDPGYPIYVPIRNKIYYVESVEHSLTYGAQFTTTLHLSYGRKPWEMLPEVLTFAPNDEIYQGGSEVLVRQSTSSTTNSKPDTLQTVIGEAEKAKLNTYAPTFETTGQDVTKKGFL